MFFNLNDIKTQLLTLGYVWDGKFMEPDTGIVTTLTLNDLEQNQFVKLALTTVDDEEHAFLATFSINDYDFIEIKENNVPVNSRICVNELQREDHSNDWQETLINEKGELYVNALISIVDLELASAKMRRNSFSRELSRVQTNLDYADSVVKSLEGKLESLKSYLNVEEYDNDECEPE